MILTLGSKIRTATILFTIIEWMLYYRHMPRIARAVAVGFHHHITQRGNYRLGIRNINAPMSFLGKDRGLRTLGAHGIRLVRRQGLKSVFSMI